ncbi:hypothetical protein BB561_003480 [Smittium simulii]|uniref:Uncharacterized protein n=1 Tax=Smittium simulii TaxID=133385 RepID=A0A2T9YL75_9FUNG|nr:hypothetical protein BB561_003480 [Smittium simulii]
MKLTNRSVYCITLAFFANLSSFVSSAVLGIDYGADSFRIALANPGKHMDVVLNRSSKRKTRSVVTMRGMERYFDDDAVGLSARFPHLTIFDAKSLLGATFQDPAYNNYIKKYPVKILNINERGDIAFDLNLPQNKTLLPQEVVAMQLKHALELTHESENLWVKDAVITIPSHFGQYERQAIKDAIEIAGINCLGLLNDGSAVALNYAMGRAFLAEPEVHMFIDIGAASTVFTVASFKSKLIKTNGVSKNITVVNNMGYSIENMLGGSEMDIRLRDYILKKFNEKYGKSLSTPIKSNNRAMARVLKEAIRVKTILSANNEITANLESLHEDLDFSLLITRKDFQSLITDLASHFVQLVDDALKKTGLKSSSIKSVIIAGGGARVPYMIEKISEVFGPDRISRGINSDEASVIGSVFKAASTSSLFRVKDIRLRDSYGFAINSVYFQESSGAFNSGKRVVNPILPKFSTIGIKKSFSDSRSTNFDIKFEVESGKTFKTFAKASITGIPEAIEKIDKAIIVNPKPVVEVSYMLDKFGLFKITGANAVFNCTNPTYDDYLEDLKKWNQEAAEFEKSKKSKKTQSSAETSSDAESSVESSADIESSKPLRSMPVTQNQFIITRFPLKVEYNLVDDNSLDQSTKTSAIEFIQRLDQFEKQKKVHDEAKNNLESFIYKVKYYVDENKVIAVTTETQRKQLLEASQKAGEWFEVQNDKTKTQLYLDQLNNLKKLYDPVYFRVEENILRPLKISESRDLIAKIKEYLQNITAKYGAEEMKLIKSEVDASVSKLKAIEDWTDSSIKKQEKLSSHEQPIIKTSEIVKKIHELKSINQSLIKNVESSEATSTLQKDSSSDKLAEQTSDKNDEVKKDQESSETKLPHHDEL